MNVLSTDGHRIYDTAIRLLRERGDHPGLLELQACADLARALDRCPVDLDEAERLAATLEIELDDLEE